MAARIELALHRIPVSREDFERIKTIMLAKGYDVKDFNWKCLKCNKEPCECN